MTSTPKAQSQTIPETSSFRDPAGFVFRHKGVLYRQLNKVYQNDFNRLMQSGLYAKLVALDLLVPHQNVDFLPLPPEAAQIIKPQIIIPFISYPYEWSFSELKDAALTTLKILKICLSYGMILRDANAYNIQFYRNQPILIDKFSFAIYQSGSPWLAYRQFCEHFLAPLSLMAYTDIRLGLLQRFYIDGIPLDLTSRLLPWSSYLNFGITTHIHLHAKSQQAYQNQTQTIRNNRQTLSRTALLGLIDSLEATINHLRWKYTPHDTEWGNYYQCHNYTPSAFNHKKELVTRWLKQVNPKKVWDLGANQGEFSRLATQQKILTIAFDIDPVAVENNYLQSRHASDPYMQPLTFDLTNPSPAIGWENSERSTLIQRGPTDVVFALALVHHLAITHNIPLLKIAEFLAKITRHLIIEFVPKSDSQVQKLLASREDIFPRYTLKAFIADFSQYFTIIDQQAIDDSQRVIFLMKRLKP